MSRASRPRIPWNPADSGSQRLRVRHSPQRGSPAEFALGHNVGSNEAVDSVMRAADDAGAAVTDAPHDREWGGYSRNFLDPDDHLWEIVWNPQLEIE